MAKKQKAIDMDPLQALIRLKHRQKGEHFMNYGKNGVRARQKALTSKSAKWGRKAALTLLKVFLIAIVGLCIIGAATGIGIFKGVIATAPSVEISALVPKGQASQVYDNAGNEIDRFVGSNANRTNVTLDQVPKHLGQAFVAIAFLSAQRDRHQGTVPCRLYLCKIRLPPDPGRQYHHTAASEKCSFLRLDLRGRQLY